MVLSTETKNTVVLQFVSVHTVIAYTFAWID